MKKLLSVILVLSTLLLCACSGKNDIQTESSTATTTETTRAIETTAVSTTKKLSKSWGSILLPEEFPAPPANAHNIKVTRGSASDDVTGYSSDWTRIIFTCPEYEFYIFANALKELGYIGGYQNFKNTTYYAEEFIGFWHNYKNIIKINHSEPNTANKNETVFTLDIVECKDNFPKPLLEFFPRFHGYTVNQGKYCGHNKRNEEEASSYQNSFSSYYWHLEFRYSNCFVGVLKKDAEEYFAKLENAGFTKKLQVLSIDGCDITAADFTKNVNGFSYGVFTMYNQNLKTFDIAYTNNSDIYLD